MALPDFVGASAAAEFQGRDLKTRQSDLLKSLPSLFSKNRLEWVRNAWGVHTHHQGYVTQAISSVFAAETSSELRDAITGKLKEFRTPPSDQADRRNRARIFERVASDEGTLTQKLGDFDAETEGTQGEKILYAIKGVKAYTIDRDMEVAVGRRAAKRLLGIWEKANSGAVDDLQRMKRMKFAAALAIGQLGYLLSGQTGTAKQTLKTELTHINQLVRGGAITLEPSLDTPIKPAPEPVVAGESDGQEQPAPDPYADLIASAENVLVSKATLARLGRTAATASRSDVVLAQLARSRTGTEG